MKLDKLYTSIKSALLHPAFIWAVISFGIIIRLVVYLENRSFWTDEISLAMNMVELNWSQLHEPLHYGQAAPLLFLYLTKAIAELFGISEMTLRFIPFLGGCLALVVFHYLAREMLSKQAALLAVALLVFSRYSIYYSAEFKQYSTDLLCTAIILLLAIKAYKSEYKVSNIALLSLTGFTLIWLSHTSIFILAGSGLALFLYLVTNKELYSNNYSSKIISLLIMGTVWLASFSLHYFLVLNNSAHDMFYDYWANGFAPFLPTSLADLLWYSSTFTSIISNPLGFSLFQGLAIFSILAGIYGLYKAKKYFYLYLLTLPLVLILAASMLKQYPIASRLILFIIPVFYIFIAEGLYLTYRSFRKEHILIGLAFILIFFAYPRASSPMWHAFQVLTSPEARQRQEIKKVLDYLFAHSEPTDSIYLYYGGSRAFDYYTLGKDLPNNLIYGTASRSEPEKYLAEIDTLQKDQRYWFIFYHVHSAASVNEERLFIIYLNKIGNELDVFKVKGASLYLYEIN